MPRIKKQYDEYKSMLPDRMPAIGEKVWVYFDHLNSWEEGRVLCFDYIDYISSSFADFS